MKYIPRYYNGLWYVTSGVINVYSTGKNREECIARCRQLNREVEAIERNPPEVSSNEEGRALFSSMPVEPTPPSEEPPGAEYLCSQCAKDIAEHPINEYGFCMQCLQSHTNWQRRLRLK